MAIITTFEFPDPESADEEGLVAVGGNLSVNCILSAYRNGIFPWFIEAGNIFWYSLDPRCVLIPSRLKISKSMQQVIRKGVFTFSMNTCFKEVIQSCKNVSRKGQSDSWIDDDILNAYLRLHELGYAHSAECKQDGVLVGGLYGLKLGNIFFGESMFATVPNASKFAFITMVEKLKADGLQLIDCQQETDHLMSLGAELMPRKLFTKMVRELSQ
jgi:leucyl/phenylalanyl-tRNA--protein transferase